MAFIKDYLPLLVVVIGSSLAHLYGRRKISLTNSNNQAKKSLEVLLEPMYFCLKSIL